MVAKAILYAPQDVRVPAVEAWLSSDPVDTLPEFADVPAAGEFIPCGRPICTVLASGGSAGECLRELNERLARLRRMLTLPAAGEVTASMVAE